MTQVRTFGAIGDQESPPSSQAMLSLLNREPGAWGRVLGSTMLRAALVAPGMLVGAAIAAPPKHRHVGRIVGGAVAGALVASVGISVFLYVWYAMQRRNQQGQSSTSVTAGTGIPSPNQQGVSAAADAARIAAQADAPVAGLGRSGVGAVFARGR